MMCHISLTKATTVNFPKKYTLDQFVQKLRDPVFCDGRVHKYQTQLCISKNLKKTVFLNFRHCNFSHRRKPWLHKYLPHQNL